MAIESFKCARHSQYAGLLLGPPWMSPEKIFKTEVLRRLENTSLRLVFANTVFHKRVILLIC